MTVLTQYVARILLLPTWMIAFAILVKGYVDTGDGFSAGVVASLSIGLQYLGFGAERSGRIWMVRYSRQLAAVGLFIAVAVVFVPVLLGDPVMTHYPVFGKSPEHVGSLEIITAVAFDIGVFLLVLGFCVAVIDLLAHSIPGRSA